MKHLRSCGPQELSESLSGYEDKLKKEVSNFNVSHGTDFDPLSSFGDHIDNIVKRDVIESSKGTLIDISLYGLPSGSEKVVAWHRDWGHEMSSVDKSGELKIGLTEERATHWSPLP